MILRYILLASKNIKKNCKLLYKKIIKINKIKFNKLLKEMNKI